MRNVHTLLGCVTITTYIWINCRRLRVPIIQFFTTIRLHMKRHFSASLSMRLSYSGQTVKCALKYRTDKTYNKQHHCIPARYGQHCTLLHTTKSLHTKTFLSQPVTYEIQYHPRQNYHIIHCYTHIGFTRHLPLLNMIQKQIPPSWIIF